MAEERWDSTRYWYDRHEAETCMPIVLPDGTIFYYWPPMNSKIELAWMV